MKVNFAYAGYTNAFNVVNEVKVHLQIFSPQRSTSYSNTITEPDLHTQENSTRLPPRRRNPLPPLQHRLLRRRRGGGEMWW